MTHASSEDRVFLESLHNRLQAVAEEMGSVVLRNGFTVFVSGYRAARGTPPRGHLRDEARASCLHGRHALRACPPCRRCRGSGRARRRADRTESVRCPRARYLRASLRVR